MREFFRTQPVVRGFVCRGWQMVWQVYRGLVFYLQQRKDNTSGHARHSHALPSSFQSNANMLKGSWHEILYFWFLSQISFHACPWSHFEFLRKFANIFQCKDYAPVSTKNVDFFSNSFIAGVVDTGNNLSLMSLLHTINLSPGSFNRWKSGTMPNRQY
jgi:hypothetical protein